MAKLDLEWLAVFDEIYKTGSVSRAAERLGMAQAAASTMLNQLRAHFDDRLFARTAQGMQPTPYAQRMLPHFMAGKSVEDAARAVLADDERLFAAFTDRSHSYYVATADERGAAYRTGTRPGDMIASEITRSVYGRLRASLSEAR